MSTPLTPKASLPPHYIVTLEGQVWENSVMTNAKVKRAFKVTIPIPAKVYASVPTKVTTDEGPIWVDEAREVHIDEIGIRTYLRRTKRLLEHLKKKRVPGSDELMYPNIHSIRSVQVLNVSASDPALALPSDPLNLNIAQLKHWIRLNNAPIDTTFFATLHQLREAVINYKEDPQSYKRYEEVMKKKHGKHAAFTAVSEQLEQAYADYENDIPETKSNNDDSEL